jgi:hypothetical protein
MVDESDEHLARRRHRRAFKSAAFRHRLKTAASITAAAPGSTARPHSIVCSVYGPSAFTLVSTAPSIWRAERHRPRCSRGNQRQTDPGERPSHPVCTPRRPLAAAQKDPAKAPRRSTSNALIVRRGRTWPSGGLADRRGSWERFKAASAWNSSAAGALGRFHRSGRLPDGRPAAVDGHRTDRAAAAETKQRRALIAVPDRSPLSGRRVARRGYRAEPAHSTRQEVDPGGEGDGVRRGV